MNKSLPKGYISTDRAHEIIEHLGSGAGVNDSTKTLIKGLNNVFRLFSSWSAQHSVRVGMHSSVLAEHLGFSQSRAANLGLSCCMHDIGKLGISPEIIEKHGPLTGLEREIVEEHVQFGIQAFLRIDMPLPEMMLNIVKHHHENFDGTGYPDGLKGEQIPYEIRIVRVMDFFDAVIFDRPYRTGLSLADTIDLMDEHAGCFDPVVFDAFKINASSINVF